MQPQLDQSRFMPVMVLHHARIYTDKSMNSPGGSAYQTTKLAQIRLNDFLLSEYGEKVQYSCPRLDPIANYSSRD